MPLLGREERSPRTYPAVCISFPGPAHRFPSPDHFPLLPSPFPVPFKISDGACWLVTSPTPFWGLRLPSPLPCHVPPFRGGLQSHGRCLSLTWWVGVPSGAGSKLGSEVPFLLTEAALQVLRSELAAQVFMANTPPPPPNPSSSLFVPETVPTC